MLVIRKKLLNRLKKENEMEQNLNLKNTKQKGTYACCKQIEKVAYENQKHSARARRENQNTR